MNVFYLLGLLLGLIVAVASQASEPIVIPSLNLDDELKEVPKINYFSALGNPQLPKEWIATDGTKLGADAAANVVPPSKTGGAGRGPFDYLLSYLAWMIYTDMPADGTYFTVPFGAGCTTLQVYKKFNPQHQLMALLTWPAQKSLIFVFRGTANFDNIKTDLQGLLTKCPMGVQTRDNGRVHSGFAKLYMKYNLDLVKIFQEAIANTGYTTRLFITGHSLACVLGQYMAFEVASKYP